MAVGKRITGDSPRPLYSCYREFNVHIAGCRKAGPSAQHVISGLVGHLIALRKNIPDTDILIVIRNAQDQLLTPTTSAYLADPEDFPAYDIVHC